jgi:hypothetical protein
MVGLPGVSLIFLAIFANYFARFAVKTFQPHPETMPRGSNARLKLISLSRVLVDRRVVLNPHL